MSTPPPVLRRADGSPFSSLLTRVGLVFGFFCIAVLGHWLEREGLKDNLDNHVSFTDVIYFTAITVTTVGYGDIVPVSNTARMFDTFVVTPIRLFIWLVFIGTAYSFLLRDRMDRWTGRRLRRMLKDHVIVCGFGPSGREAVDELMGRGIPAERIVVIDERAGNIALAAPLELVTLNGDPTRNVVLQEAEVARAKSVIVAPGRDDTAVLIVLTVRRLAPHVRISVEILEHDNEPLAKGAGADTVVNPVAFGGQLLAMSTEGMRARDYIADLVTGEGRVHLRERPVLPSEIGHPLSAVTTGRALRIYRGERIIGFWEADAAELREGDVLIEVVPCGEESA